jgi:hypothetical protein
MTNRAAARNKLLKRSAEQLLQRMEMYQLIQKALNDREAFIEEIERIRMAADLAGRLNELERIQSATMDVDRNVWSTRDDGTLIPFPDRLDELRKF